MPKEVKQKSGLIVGLNAGHSTFAPSPSLEPHPIVPQDRPPAANFEKQRTLANKMNRGHPEDPRSQDLQEEGFPVQAHRFRPRDHP